MEIKDQLVEIAKKFEAFKEVHAKELAEVKEFGVASKMTTEKLAKIEADLQKSEKAVEDMKAALNRQASLGAESQDDSKEAAQKYNKNFNAFAKGTLETMTAEDRAHYQKQLSVQSDEDGGFMVSPEMSSEIVKKVFESSPMRELASVQIISTDALEMIEDLDEAASGWVGETDARPETNTPKLKKIRIPVHELYANPKATQKLLDDGAFNAEAWLAGKVAEKFARDEATAFISGNGAGKPKGLLAYDSGTGFDQVERQLTAANNAISGDDLINLQNLLKEPYQGNATWLINRSIIGVIRKLKDSGTPGQYLWQPGLQVGQPGILLGRTVRMASDLPASVVASTDTIIYGDIRQAYQIVDRIGVRVLRDPYSAKPFVMFYTTKRVGGGVKNFEASKVLRINT